MSLNNLGTMHRDLGQREAALAATQAAVAHYLVLVKALPAAFMQSFEISVRNLAGLLQESEQPVESHPIMKAAMEFLEPYKQKKGADNESE